MTSSPGLSPIASRANCKRRGARIHREGVFHAQVSGEFTLELQCDRPGGQPLGLENTQHSIGFLRPDGRTVKRNKGVF